MSSLRSSSSFSVIPAKKRNKSLNLSSLFLYSIRNYQTTASSLWNLKISGLQILDCPFCIFSLEIIIPPKESVVRSHSPLFKINNWINKVLNSIKWLCNNDESLIPPDDFVWLLLSETPYLVSRFESISLFYHSQKIKVKILIICTLTTF